MKTALFVPCVLLAASSVWADGSARYTIRAEIDVRRNIISGTETLSVTNPSSVPLNQLHLFLYPNRFRQKDPGLDEMNHRWHYPSGVDKGRLDVGAMTDASGRAVQGTIDESALPGGTVFRVDLPEPLAPGAEQSLTLEFTTKVPHKFGPFGHYRDTITAQGGWYPYLVPIGKDGHPLVHALPEPGSFQATITLNAARDVVVNGELFDDVSELSVAAEDARYLTLVVARQYYPTERQVGNTLVTFYSLEAQRYKIGPIMRALDQAVTSAQAFFPVEPPDRVTLVETPLRAVMTYPGEDMILVSDRFFVTVTMFDMRNLNILEGARAVGSLFVADAVTARENAFDYNWVDEALAWAFRNEFLAATFPKLNNLRETANQMGMFRPFNRMAASPTIPFSATYVGSGTDRDLLRESLLYFNNDLPSGRLFTEKLPGTIGDAVYATLVNEYLQHDQDFQATVDRVAGQDLAWFFDQWKGRYPPDLDYRLADVTRNQKTDTGYLTIFTVQKDTAGDLIDPVEVRVHEGGGTSETLTWDGRGASKRFEVPTTTKVTEIEIDPRRQTVQTNEFNDLAPHGWEMVIDRGDVDVSSGGFGAGMRIRMHKVRDRSKYMFVLPFFSPSELGAEAGMLFDFGGHVDGLVWDNKQELSLSYTFTDLRGGFADELSGFTDSVGQASGIKMRYTFQNKMFEEDPMNFETFELNGALYRSEFGGDFNFFQASMSGSILHALHPKHKIGAIFVLAYSDGFSNDDIIPTQKLQDIGQLGVNGTVKAGNHLGRNAMTMTLEWRHDLMSGLNMAMPMNMRVRRLQGVLALDSGWVTQDDVGHLFRLNQGFYGIRYGLRFHYDFIGIRPSDFTFDIGHRFGNPSGQVTPTDGTTFSLGILQSF